MARPHATGIATAMGLVRNADAAHHEYPVRSIVHHWCNATIVHGVHCAINPVLVAAQSQEQKNNPVAAVDTIRFGDVFQVTELTGLQLIPPQVRLRYSCEKSVIRQSRLAQVRL